MNNAQYVLSVKGLSKNFKDIKAVDNISFDVRKGEIFGFLGPNGAGKTTTIRMICGLVKEDTGDIMINGMSMATNYEETKSVIGVCPQEIVIWGRLTCMEQLMFSGISYGLKRAAVKDRSTMLLNKLGLDDKKHKLAETLSGGMQRRLNIALALVHDPELIILDEPQAGLDPRSRILVRDFIKELAIDKTVILTTHDMDEADRLSDRVAIIDQGRILMIDTPEAIKMKSNNGDILRISVKDLDDETLTEIIGRLPYDINEATYVDAHLNISANNLINLVPLISQEIEKLGMEIDDITIRKRTLEDAFIDMTGRGLRE